VVRQLSVEIVANLIETTPVDTGWAKANWVPSVGLPVIRPGSFEPPDTLGIASARGQQTAGTLGLLSYTYTQGSVFISNNVPYVPRLNAGSSTQAPAGFVENAIEKALRDLKLLEDR
jgi:hypothetical protein